MGEEFEAAGAICGDNYWWNNNNSSARSMFPLMMGSTCSVAANNDAAGNNYTYSAWQTDFMDLKQQATTTTRCCSASAAAAAEDDSNNINNFATSLDAHSNSIKVPVPQQSEESAADGTILIDSTLHMMAFALSSSPSSIWNHNNNNIINDNHHSLLFGGRAENNFECVVQEETGTVDSCNNPSSCAGQVCSVDGDFKPMMKQQELFPIDEQSMSMSMSSVTSSRGLSSSGSYGGYPCSTLASVFSNPSSNYGTWCTTTVNPPKQQQQQLISNNGLLHFSNNTPFWNASPDALHDLRPTVFSSSSSSSTQPQYQSTTFDDKSNSPTAPLNNNNNNKLKREECPEKASSSAANKSGSEAAAAAFKRPRIETPSPLPTFKVRKEKLGDRITALQQLVSPFGKTDTSSVLHEAIEYIKFLHDQVNVLSTPYMKNGTPIPQQQGGCENMNKESSLSLSEGEGGKQELRRRGLCLVPISSTFPMATETTADFWTPTFGGGPLIGGRQ